MQTNVSGVLIMYQIDLKWQFPVCASSLHFKRKYKLLSNVPSSDQASTSTELIFCLFLWWTENVSVNWQRLMGTVSNLYKIPE